MGTVRKIDGTVHQVSSGVVVQGSWDAAYTANEWKQDAEDGETNEAAQKVAAHGGCI